MKKHILVLGMISSGIASASTETLETKTTPAERFW